MDRSELTIELFLSFHIFYFAVHKQVHNIIDKFRRPRQTILFSATMPQKFQDFAKNTLIKPLLVNVGRAGAANLDVIQEVGLRFFFILLLFLDGWSWVS